MGTKFTGITARTEKSIEIYFSYQGKKCRETIKTPATTENLRKAANHRAAILHAIDNGTFNYREVFPDSKNAREFKLTSSASIESYLKDWIVDIKDSLHSSTYLTHTRRINGVLTKEFGDISIDELRWHHVKTWSKKNKSSIKTQKNIISILRTALDDAVDDELIEINPLAGKQLRNRLSNNIKVDEIDPFNEVERDAIFQHCDGQILNYITFQMWTGLRPSETAALQWDDIDWINGTINVTKALTDAADEPEVPKTQSGVRRVKILPDAMDALINQKEHTYLENNGIFHNPRTGGHLKQRAFIKSYWKRALKLAGVRYRYPYQMRHTYATMMLLAGEPLYWVSNQLGHAKPSFTIDTYFRFIPEDAPNAGNMAAEKWSKKSGQKVEKQVKNSQI